MSISQSFFRRFKKNLDVFISTEKALSNEQILVLLALFIWERHVDEDEKHGSFSLIRNLKEHFSSIFEAI